MRISNDEMEQIKDFVWDRLSRTYMSYFEWTGPDGDDNEWAGQSLSEARRDMKAADFTYGCTKSCFYFDELEKYVIKIPFMGEAWDEYEDDDENWEYPETQYAEYEFGGCIRVWDYCEVEADLYKEAIERGVEDMLCGTWFLGLYEGYPIYVSERADRSFYDGRREFIYSSKDNSTKSAKGIMDSGKGYFELDILSMMVDSVGEEKVAELMDFIGCFGISDFHDGNFMFMKDGDVRLVDYSSYNG